MLETIALDHPMIAKENWEHFTQTDHHTWEILFKRQSQILERYAALEVLEGMHRLKMDHRQIPKFSELNTILLKNSGFSIVPVTGLIPTELFFRFLAQRQFPSTCFIRRPDQLDYLEEPDIFHDVYGHIPLLIEPVFADFMQALGQKGVEAIEHGMVEFASALYWFTVEFGLIQQNNQLKIYGAGITSSIGESHYSIKSPIPVRIRANVIRMMQTIYHVDSFQKTYFVIESFEQLFQLFENLDWERLRPILKAVPKIPQGIIIQETEKHILSC